MKHAIVLVGFEPDWEALYVMNVKVAEGHHVTPAELVEHTGDLVWEEWGPEHIAERGWPGVHLETTHVEEDEMDEHGEIEIPEFLDGLAKLAPKAYERISA